MAVINSVIQRRAAQAVRVLAPHVKICAAYVFGSHVDGTPDAYSDIDLAVFVEDMEAWDIFRRADVTAHVQGKVGDDLELHYFAAQALVSPDPASFAAHVLSHGLPIKDTHEET